MCRRRWSDKQRRFAEEYLVDLNATQAALRAGYSAKTAHFIGPQLLRKTHIAAAIQVAQQARSERTEITADRVLQELALIGFADLAEFIDWDVRGVRLRDSATLPAAKRRAVVEVSETASGIRIKLADKKGSLELLGRHLGLWEKPENNDTDRKYLVVMPQEANSIDEWRRKYSH